MLKSKAIKNKTIKSRPLTVAEGMLDLLKVCAVPIETKGSVIWLRTKIKRLSDFTL